MGEGVTTAQGGGRPSRLPPSEQRERIVEAAVRLLARQPFADITVERLREDLNLSKGGLYHHIRSKSEILLLVCEHAGEAMLAALENARGTVGTPRQRLEVLIGSHLDVVDRYGGALWAFFSEREHMDVVDRERVLQWERRYLEGVVDLLEEAKHSGELRDVDLVVLAHTVIGVANWTTRWYRGRPTRSALAESIGSILFDGAFVSVPSGSRSLE